MKQKNLNKKKSIQRLFINIWNYGSRVAYISWLNFNVIVVIHRVHRLWAFEKVVDESSCRHATSIYALFIEFFFSQISDHFKLQFNFQAWVWWILMYAYHISRWILYTVEGVKWVRRGEHTNKRRFNEIFIKFCDFFTLLTEIDDGWKYCLRPSRVKWRDAYIYNLMSWKPRKINQFFAFDLLHSSQIAHL